MLFRSRSECHQPDQVDDGVRGYLREDDGTSSPRGGSRGRADITQDDRKNEAFYAVRIRISDKEMARLEGLHPMAGMPVEVFIKTSPRTVLSYLTKPLREQFDRAFRGR